MLVLGMTLAVLIAGELQALAALASEHPARESPQNVYTAVAVGLAIVGFVALFGDSRDVARRMMDRSDVEVQRGGDNTTRAA